MSQVIRAKKKGSKKGVNLYVTTEKYKSQWTTKYFNRSGLEDRLKREVKLEGSKYKRYK